MSAEEKAPTPCRTLKDLAAVAGCSVNTVSLALRNNPRLPEKTRTRIQDLAQKHGYRPNPLVSALMAHRRHAPAHEVIAVLTKFHHPYFPLRDNFYYTQLLEGMEAKAAELGFHLEEFPILVPGAPDGKRLTRILRARGIRGVIFFQSGEFSDEFPDLEWEHFAIVGLGFHTKSQRMHRIATDQLLALEMCLNYAMAHGAKRIGLAVSSSLDPRMRYAAAGRFFAWQSLHPNMAALPPVRTPGERLVQADFDAWILEHQPDWIIAEQPHIEKWVQEINPQLRRPAKCLFFNRSPALTFSGVDARLPLVGKTAISVLARELYLNHYGLPEAPEVILVSGAWAEGASSAIEGATKMPAGQSSRPAGKRKSNLAAANR